MWRRWFGGAVPGVGGAASWQPYAGSAVRRRVALVIHNPLIEAEGNRRLTEVFGWHDPDALAAQYIADLHAASGGYVQYEIVERLEVDGYPAKLDGFRYDDASYLRAWRSKRGFHQPDAIDYEQLLAEFAIMPKVEAGTIDEAWFFAFPYSGDYESTMAGRGAFWCNSPPVPNTDQCQRRFVAMAFNYERDVGCMLENFGHRVESIMSRVFQQHPPQQNLWEHFTRYDAVFPGLAACGNVHFAPNSQRDYDWGNRRTVLSSCDDWYGFPELGGTSRAVSCDEWGGGDMRAHHVWWLRHLPRTTDTTFGVENNWWRYILDPQLVR